MSSPFRGPSTQMGVGVPLATVAPFTRPGRAVRPTAASYARRTAQRRRRDVFLALLMAAGTTLLLGAIPALRFLWLAHVAADVLLFGYVALLIRQRNLATERELKVRLLPTAARRAAAVAAAHRDAEGPWLAAEPALLRRSAT